MTDIGKRGTRRDGQAAGASDEQVNQTIGRKIFKLRKMLGFTQEGLGKMLGVSSQQVQKYECGLNAVSPAKLIQLARLFRCSLDHLCNFEVLEDVGIVVDDTDFLKRSDFRRTQLLFRRFLNIESPELRNIAYDMIKGFAALDISALVNRRISATDKY